MKSRRIREDDVVTISKDYEELTREVDSRRQVNDQPLCGVSERLMVYLKSRKDPHEQFIVKRLDGDGDVWIRTSGDSSFVVYPEVLTLVTEAPVESDIADIDECYSSDFNLDLKNTSKIYSQDEMGDERDAIVDFITQNELPIYAYPEAYEYFVTRGNVYDSNDNELISEIINMKEQETLFFQRKNIGVRRAKNLFEKAKNDLRIEIDKSRKVLI